MALSNPLHGPRKEGTVGKPLPRVEVCYDFLVVRDIVKKDLRFILYCFMPLKAFFFSQAKIIMDDGTETKAGVGELCIRSPSLFREYWKRPEVRSQSKELFRNSSVINF
jgi:malonyl-CoA/methylmalonyl-CoA synthetase